MSNTATKIQPTRFVKLFFVMSLTNQDVAQDESGRLWLVPVTPSVGRPYLPYRGNARALNSYTCPHSERIVLAMHNEERSK
jgi:hypothetical protein